MLSAEDNDLITRVGPGTPMGRFMREYWVPAMLSSELPEPDGTPLRVMLLGEKLIAFRDSNGQVGLVGDACPHRGASMWFGRNEECGLRCVYHGWKFDVQGKCVDMPNEPAESNFKNKVAITAYPCRERGGIVWAYMGPRSTPPDLPDIEANMQGENSVASAVLRECNWLQAAEGEMDTSHAGLLHFGSVRPEDQPRGTFAEYVVRDRTPRYEVLEVEAGMTYGAYRDANPGEEYWRIANFLFPFYTQAPQGLLGFTKFAVAWVPMDDYHTIQLSIAVRAPGQIQAPPTEPRFAFGGAVVNVGNLPDSSDWFGRFRPTANAGNDYLIDRELQRRNEGIEGYTGIRGIVQQDQAVQESMGSIMDRTKEHLGTADAMIIRTRRRIIASLRDFIDAGTVPPGVDNPAAFGLRAGGTFITKGWDWVDATKELRKAFIEHPDLDPSITGRGIAG